MFRSFLSVGVIFSIAILGGCTPVATNSTEKQPGKQSDAKRTDTKAKTAAADSAPKEKTTADAKATAPAKSEKESEEEKEIKASLAKLSPEDRKLAEAQRLCPVTDEKLGSMGAPMKMMIKGQPVFVCCKGCKDDAEKDADGTIKKVAELTKKK